MAAIFGRFSRPSQAVLEEAQRHAERLGRPVQSDIILLSILSQNGSPAADLLKTVGASYTRLFEQLPPHYEVNIPNQPQEIHIILEESIKLAGKFRFAFVEIEHILYVIARDERLMGNMLLRKAGIEPGLIIARLSEWLFSISLLAQQPNQEQAEGTKERAVERVELEKYTLDVTEAAEEGKLDPVIGREQELEEMIHILLRRRKNNPLLLGEPGVGKTALVDALAQRIIAKQVPRALIGKQILTLDLSLVVAGTMYRGQFEERLKSIIQEVQVQGNAILFIDEIHTLSGTGSAEGGFDAANILKPALARGEISLIGATTHEEYRKHILKDKALDRRFQTLTISEPTSKEATMMLRGIRRELESHHGVSIPDETITSAIELSTRYIHDRFLPDKAIDLLDEAAALHAEPFNANSELEQLHEEIARISLEKAEAVEQAVTDAEYEYAKVLSERETVLLEKLQLLKRRINKERRRPSVSPLDVSHVVAVRTGIPLRDIQQVLEPLDVERVFQVLTKHVLGQDEALKRISQSLLRSQLGLNQSHKPIGSFLLVGPTGVGKTETARILAKEVFGDANALVKVDMSEYMERHSVSNLVGAPAGYVGFEQGGSLTEQVRRRPYAVVLFDEVEKAHPDVFNILLQILEDGKLTDNTGAVTSFEHTLILMTSNIGMASFNQMAHIGFAPVQDEDTASLIKSQELERHIDKQLRDFFRPELLGRLSGILYYKPLRKPIVRKLVLRHLHALKGKLKTRGYIVASTPQLIDWIGALYDPESGARSLDKVFLHQIEPALIQHLATLNTHKRITITVENDAITIHPNV